MRRWRRIALLALLVAVLGWAWAGRGPVYRDRGVEMVPVASLDTERYLGLWYEIARFPNRFEEGCEGVTADYALREDGDISVLNTCRDGAPDGPARSAEGVAKIEGPGRLTVGFVPWLPFARGDYWVLYVDDAYRLAVVGAPKGTTGWILARSPSISATDRAQAEAVLKLNGYDVGQLRDVRQGPGS